MIMVMMMLKVMVTVMAITMIVMIVLTGMNDYDDDVDDDDDGDDDGEGDDSMMTGVVPGGPPLILVMGVFPWKLNSRCIFLSHLVATANALSPQIRDRGLHCR